MQSLSHWAPVCVGPYSQVNTLRGGLHFCAGQIGLVPATMRLRHCWREQLEQCWTNVARVLDALDGGALDDLVSCLLYVAADSVFDERSSNNGDGGVWDTTTMQSICRTQMKNNGGVVPGAVDGTSPRPSSTNSDGANGYEDEETRREIEGDAAVDEHNSDNPQLTPPCPILVVAIPQMPVGALTEVEVVAATRKAALSLKICDQSSSLEHSLSHAHSAARVDPAAPLGWDTGYDFEQAPHAAENRTVRVDTFVRSLGSHAATFGLVTAGWLQSTTSENSRSSSKDVDVQWVLSRMLTDLLNEPTFDSQHVLHLRLYFIATSRCCVTRSSATTTTTALPRRRLYRWTMERDCDPRFSRPLAPPLATHPPRPHRPWCP